MVLKKAYFLILCGFSKANSRHFEQVNILLHSSSLHVLQIWVTVATSPSAKFIFWVTSQTDLFYLLLCPPPSSLLQVIRAYFLFAFIYFVSICALVK